MTLVTASSPQAGGSFADTRKAVRTGAPAWLFVTALAAIAVASRLPQLLSPNLLLDGDEALAGLMVKHLAQGHELPIFFYGQHYGFAPIETALAALSFLAFGTGAIALKVAMLALWTAGVAFLFLALAPRVGATRAFWTAAVLLVTPAWAVPSMKAWSGYVTSFTASAALAWLVTRPSSRETIVRWLAAGALTGVVYLAQPVWLPSVLPIVAAILVARRRPWWAVACAAAATVVIVGFKLVPATRPDPWAGPSLGNPNLFPSLPELARQVYVNFTGAYYLWWPIDSPGRATTWLAVLWCAAIPAAALLQVYRLATRRYCAASHLVFAGICATLAGEWLLLSARDGRYMLPLGAPLVTLAGIEFADLVDRRLVPRSVVATVVPAILLIGSLSAVEFGAFNFLWTNPPIRLSEAKRLQRVIGDLEVHGATHVYSMNGLVDPQLVFYSDERIIARWTDPIGRYPAYARAVDLALARGEPVAVVGYTDTSGAPGCWDVPICTGGIEALVPNPESIFTVDGKYFVYIGADRALLEKLHFKFAE